MRMGLGLGLGRNWRAGAVPVDPSQTAQFGALTEAGRGGWQPSTFGFDVDALVSYDGLASGSLGSHTPSISAGRLIFSGAVGAPNGAAVLVTGTSGLQYTATVETIADSYSAAGHAEMLRCIAIAGLTYGQQILLRTANFIDTEQHNFNARVRRTTPIAGTLVPHSDFASRIANFSLWTRGRDLSTGNHVTIRPHSGARPRMGTINVDGMFSGANPTGLRFSGLNFQPGKAFLTIGAVVDLTVDNCVFEPTNPLLAWETGTTPPTGLIGRMNFPNGGCTRLTVQDNTITEADFGIRLNGTNLEGSIVGNRLKRTWQDSIQFSTGVERVCWNESTDKETPPAVVSAHADHYQAVGYSDGLVVVGNLASPGLNTFGRLDVQGIFLSDASTTPANIVVAGNTILVYATRAISISKGNNPYFYGNAAIGFSADVDSGRFFFTTTAGNTAGLFENNTATEFGIDPVATQTNNVVLLPAAYATNFVNPDPDLPLASPAWFAGWTPLQGSTVEDIFPIGASWINYATRSITVPELPPPATNVELIGFSDVITDLEGDPAFNFGTVQPGRYVLIVGTRTVGGATVPVGDVSFNAGTLSPMASSTLINDRGAVAAYDLTVASATASTFNLAAANRRFHWAALLSVPSGATLTAGVSLNTTAQTIDVLTGQTVISATMHKGAPNAAHTGSTQIAAVATPTSNSSGAVSEYVAPSDQAGRSFPVVVGGFDQAVTVTVKVAP